MSKRISTHLVLHKYFVEKLSLRQIASELDTYPKKIERVIKRAGRETRNRPTAQKNFHLQRRQGIDNDSKRDS